MDTIRIRLAAPSDKPYILDFSTNTFSWGDYIKDVWDFWIKEGNLYVVEKITPIGMCHCVYSHNQIWIEGIRIHPNFRCIGLASSLIKNIEQHGIEMKIPDSLMLIESTNKLSLKMADRLDYRIHQTWNFYSLVPKPQPNNNVSFYDVTTQTLSLLHNDPYFVKSWRWSKLSIDNIVLLSNNKQIIYCDDSYAILTESEHFGKTLIVTFFHNSVSCTQNLLYYLQNLSYQKNYKRIQILTQEYLPEFSGLEHKLVFHLMKKSFSEVVQKSDSIS